MAVKQTYLDSDGAEVDVSTSRPMPSISTPHLRIHQGKFFHASYLVPHASPIADNASVDIFFTTGALSAHLLSTINGAGDIESRIYTGPTATGNQTEQPSYNNNQNNSTESTSKMYFVPSVTVPGTQLGGGVFLPGGSGPQSSGGNQTPDHELVLAPNTDYLFKTTNVSGGALQLSIELGWYEDGS
jgi:hypothetical protein